jgi:hypothetical protein
MKFKLIFRLFGVLIMFVSSYVDKFDNGSFYGNPGDLAEICIRDCNCSLNPENDRLGVELHLSQEVY